MELTATGALDNENHRMNMRLDVRDVLPHITVLRGRVYHLDPLAMQEFRGETAPAPA